MIPYHAYWLCLDIETLHSSEDCRLCLTPWDSHDPLTAKCPQGDQQAAYEALHSTENCIYYKIGWGDKAALGLSVGCAWDSRYGRTSFFDVENLEETMQRWVDEQPLIVTFNGHQFDLLLLRGILRRRAETLEPDAGAALVALCDAFKLLCAESYDILVEVWKADPSSKKVKGLNTLDSLARANGLGGKTGHGADAPRDWAAGKIAQVISYCQNDVYLTKSLIEMVLRGSGIQRSDGSILYLPIPAIPMPAVL